MRAAIALSRRVNCSINNKLELGCEIRRNFIIKTIPFSLTRNRIYVKRSRTSNILISYHVRDHTANQKGNKRITLSGQILQCFCSDVSWMSVVNQVDIVFNDTVLWVQPTINSEQTNYLYCYTILASGLMFANQIIRNRADCSNNLQHRLKKVDQAKFIILAINPTHFPHKRMPLDCESISYSSKVRATVYKARDSL